MSPRADFDTQAELHYESDAEYNLSLNNEESFVLENVSKTNAGSFFIIVVCGKKL